MSVLPPANLAALQLLQQTHLTSLASGAKERQADSNAILTVTASPAQPRQPDPMFSPTLVDVNKLKVHYMEQVGKALGLEVDDFETASAFGQAIKDEIIKIRQSPDAEKIIRKIEEDSGLDELGISLVDFANALIDPESRAAEKLQKALQEMAGELAGQDGTDAPVRFDEIGIYSFI